MKSFIKKAYKLINFYKSNILDLKVSIENRIEEMKSEKSLIHSKIEFWLDKIESDLKSLNEISQKKKELIDLGKFIYCFNHNINIIDALCESPDFLISENSDTIGIELTDIVIRSKEKEKEGVLKKIFNQIEIELRKESVDYNGIYRVDFIDKISFNKKNQSEIKLEIIKIIKEEINFGNHIKEIRKTYHTNIYIYHTEASVVGELDRKTVEKKIKKKENKLTRYSSERFKEIWLLLVIGGVKKSDDYSFVEEEIMNSPFETNFHRIFILNFFKSNIFELKTTLSL